MSRNRLTVCAQCGITVALVNGALVEVSQEYDDGRRYRRGLHTADRCGARVEWKRAQDRRTVCAVCGESFDGDRVRWHGTPETGLCAGYEG